MKISQKDFGRLLVLFTISLLKYKLYTKNDNLLALFMKSFNLLKYSQYTAIFKRLDISLYASLETDSALHEQKLLSSSFVASNVNIDLELSSFFGLRFVSEPQFHAHFTGILIDDGIVH